MRKPLVLHVAEFRNPGGGGFVAGLTRLAQRHHDFETALLCPDDGYSWIQRLKEAGVRVHVAQRQIEVTAAVARLRPAIVHAHFVSWSLPATIGATAVRAHIAWHLHSGIRPGSATKSLTRRLKYAAARRLVDRFYCVSPDIATYLQRFGIPTAQIVELPNGVDLDRFRPPSLAERVAARRRFGLAPRERAILFFGRDAFVKGADRLERALSSSPSRTRVIAVASSPDTLRILAGSSLIDVGSLSDVREVLWAADAIAFPSRSEGVAYSLLEARACGLPAVASALPGIVRALSADSGTQIIDAEDSVAFANALDRAFERGCVPLSPESAAALSLDVWADALAAWYATALAA